MTAARSPLALRSRAALEEEASWNAWYLGHYSAAIRYWTRSARHTLAARKIEKGGAR